MVKRDARKVIGVSLSPEAYGKLRLLGGQLGLKDSQAAKHLIMMSLQQLMGQLQQLEQGQVLKTMADMVASPLFGGSAGEDWPIVEAVRDQALESAGASNTGTGGQKCPLPRKRKGGKRS